MSELAVTTGVRSICLSCGKPVTLVCLRAAKEYWRHVHTYDGSRCETRPVMGFRNEEAARRD